MLNMSVRLEESVSPNWSSFEPNCPNCKNPLGSYSFQEDVLYNLECPICKFIIEQIFNGDTLHQNAPYYDVTCPSCKERLGKVCKFWCEEDVIYGFDCPDCHEPIQMSCRESKIHTEIAYSEPKPAISCICCEENIGEPFLYSKLDKAVQCPKCLCVMRLGIDSRDGRLRSQMKTMGWPRKNETPDSGKKAKTS